MHTATLIWHARYTWFYWHHWHRIYEKIIWETTLQWKKMKIAFLMGEKLVRPWQPLKGILCVSRTYSLCTRIVLYPTSIKIYKVRGAIYQKLFVHAMSLTPHELYSVPQQTVSLTIPLKMLQGTRFPKLDWSLLNKLAWRAYKREPKFIIDPIVRLVKILAESSLISILVYIPLTHLLKLAFLHSQHPHPQSLGCAALFLVRFNVI
jgi:hypothetical protein